MLYQYAKDFEGKFAPYSYQSMDIMLPLVSFGFHENLRIVATSKWYVSTSWSWLSTNPASLHAYCSISFIVGLPILLDSAVKGLQSGDTSIPVSGGIDTVNDYFYKILNALMGVLETFSNSEEVDIESKKNIH